MSVRRHGLSPCLCEGKDSRHGLSARLCEGMDSRHVPSCRYIQYTYIIYDICIVLCVLSCYVFSVYLLLCMRSACLSVCCLSTKKYRAICSIELIHSMVMTCTVQLNHDELGEATNTDPVLEEFVIPPRMVADTTHEVLGTAVVQSAPLNVALLVIFVSCGDTKRNETATRQTDK